MHLKGFASANLRGNLRTNKPDGGVDTAVDVILDAQSRWFECPTAWQFKSCEARDVTNAELRREIKKEYAAELVSKGYGYRLCICDELPPEKKSEWESELFNAASEMTGKPPAPRVLTASDLASVANDQPSVILSHFQPYLATLAQGFAAWGETITNLTRSYVSLPTWESLADRLRTHFNFSAVCHAAVFPLKGEAGVGKSRFVYEVLRATEGAQFLVVYTTDRHIEVANYLANHNAGAVLVADECSPEIESQLEDILRGHRGRVRAIAIRNDARPPSSGAPEFRLSRMSEMECEGVLTANFPEIPRDSRRDYARLCQGFVRLAGDMCENHANIAEAGHAGPILDRVRDYFERRIPRESDRAAVEALALLPKVGYTEDVSEQLNLLCKAVNLSPQSILEVAKSLHDKPGFVAKTTRFLYVTPQIIAQVAFSAAWRRWVQDDPRGFFKRLPEALLPDFQERVRTTALPEERRVFAEFFFDWLASLKPSDLGDPESVGRLISLTEVEPEIYLAHLNRLFSEASNTEIGAIRNEQQGWIRTGSRRNLVWLLERLVWFPEYFDSSEEILLRLAVNETEPDIGNNATAVWVRLYSAVLPGTAETFDERLVRLRRRALTIDDRVQDLAFDALRELFNTWVTRLDVPALGGRVRPREATPRTETELRDNVRAALALVVELSGNPDRTVRRRAQAAVAKNLRSLLRMGNLEQLQELFRPGEIEAENLPEVLGNLDQFLHFDGGSAVSEASKYVDDVHAWRRVLQPSDIHSRLVSSVGIEPWEASMVREDEWRAELRELAKTLLGNGGALDAEMPWLCSEGAKGAVYFGQELGAADNEGHLLERIIEAAVREGRGSLARGYLIGVLPHPAVDRMKLNRFLDSVEESSPTLAFDIFIVGGALTKAVERTLRLVDEGKLPLAYLRSFAAPGSLDPDPSQFEALLEKLVTEAEKSNITAREIALDILGYRIAGKSRHLNHLEQNSVRELAWRLVQAAASDAGRESHWWAELVKKLGQLDARRAAKIASTGLVSSGFNHSHSASEVLACLAKDHPEEVMEEVGTAMLDDSKGGWRLLVGKYPLVAQLPWEIVAEWINRQGVTAAERLAGQLPPPRLDETGQPVVPPLTRYVLGEFEDSEEVFQAFVRGVHNLQGYQGDIAGQHEQEAEMARKFLDDRLRRIREWAALEVRQARAEADYWRRVEEEMHIP
jgi:hypothetical protein